MCCYINFDLINLAISSLRMPQTVIYELLVQL